MNRLGAIEVRRVELAELDIPDLLIVARAAASVVEHMEGMAASARVTDTPGPHDWCYTRQEGTWPRCIAALRDALAPMLEEQP